MTNKNLPDGVTVVSLDDPAELHNAIADAVGEPRITPTVTIAYNPDYDEYRVPAPDGREEGAYYTNWKDDAVDTAKVMYGGAPTIRFKRAAT